MKRVLPAGIALALAVLAFLLITHNPISGGGGAEAEAYFFYSENCPHCQAVKPAVFELAEKRKIKICEVSSMPQECRSVAEKIGLRFVPAMVIMKEKPEIFIGADEVMKAVEMLRK